MGEPKRAKVPAQQTITLVIALPFLGAVVTGSIHLHIQERMRADHQQIQTATDGWIATGNAGSHLKAEQEFGNRECLAETDMSLGIQINTPEPMLRHR